MATGFADAALAVLRRALGPSARFRDGQLEAIEALVEHRSRLLVVQRTGCGKSVVSDELVEAAAALVKDWLAGFDGTVVFVPSLDPTRRLVADFALRLAAA